MYLFMQFVHVLVVVPIVTTSSFSLFYPGDDVPNEATEYMALFVSSLLAHGDIFNNQPQWPPARHQNKKSFGEMDISSAFWLICRTKSDGEEDDDADLLLLMLLLVLPP